MEKVEELTLAEKVMLLIQRFRFVLIGLLVAAVVIVVAFIIADQIHKSNVNATSLESEALGAAQSAYGNETDQTKKAAALTTYKAAIETAKKSGMAFVRQEALVDEASLYLADKKYAESADAAAAASKIISDSYLAPVALFIGAQALEAQGKIDEAIAQLAAIAGNFAKTSAITPRALFDLGRLYEGKGDYAKAKENYDKIASDFANSYWKKHAENRIILLTASGKIVAKTE